MGIIVILVAMLMPAVNRAVIAVRKANTKARIASIQTALDTFKTDWGTYPPSDPGNHGMGEAPGEERVRGANLLSTCLMGPESRGWGRDQENDKLPFGGTNGSKAFGPYFKIEGVMPSAGIPDAFPSPLRYVLYYKYDPSESTYQYDYKDNPNVKEGESADPDVEDLPTNGFVSQTHFEYSAKYLPPGGRTAADMLWHRKDYLLISPGEDRLYGYVYEDFQDDNRIKAAETSQKRKQAMCDDITNFN